MEGENMIEILKKFPDQFVEGYIIGKKTEFRKTFKDRGRELIVAGMGGSALPGRVLPQIFSELGVANPTLLWNTYLLPSSAYKNPLVICISYSGNTEETLSTFGEALRKKRPLITITSGGKLALLSRKNRVPLVLIPGGIAPRMAFGYMLGGLLGALSALKIIPNVLPRLERAKNRVDFEETSRRAKGLAKFLWPGIALIYTSENWKGLGHIWKIALNETAKMPAFHYNLPEMNHNEMQGLAQNPTKFAKFFKALFIKNEFDQPRVRKRFLLTEKVLRRSALIKTKTITLEGPDVFSKIISSSLLAHWTSYEIAGLRRIDPMNDRVIEGFKKEMARRR